MFCISNWIWTSLLKFSWWKKYRIQGFWLLISFSFLKSVLIKVFIEIGIYRLDSCSSLYSLDFDLILHMSFGYREKSQPFVYNREFNKHKVAWVPSWKNWQAEASPTKGLCYMDHRSQWFRFVILGSIEFFLWFFFSNKKLGWLSTDRRPSLSDVNQHCLTSFLVLSKFL